MIVVVETNFVLELVFSRDKFAACNTLIEMAERKELVLFLPAYSVLEPYEAIIRRRKARVQAHDSLLRETRELTRSMQFQEQAKQLADLTGLLIEVGETEQNELRTVISRLLEVATLIDLDQAVIRRAIGFQDELAMPPQDSVVFASVLYALEKNGGPGCFITKNSKDFSDPRIEEALDAHDCKLLFDFENGLSFIRTKLAARPA